ncbi:hypothetical protein D3C80_1279190 [compost metagenome]
MLSHRVLVVADATAFAIHQPEIHGRLVFSQIFKAKGVILWCGLNGREWYFLKHEGRVHPLKKRIYAGNHTRRRTPVRVEGVVRFDLATRLHVGENIRAAKRINRLFGVTNQEQRGIRLLTPDTPENTILLWVGILEFINHRHRESGANRSSQRLTVFAAQCCIQSAQHIVETEFSPTIFLTRDRFTDLCHGARDHQIIQRKRLRKQGFDSYKQGVFRHNAVGFCAICQKVLCKFFKRIG